MSSADAATDSDEEIRRQAEENGEDQAGVVFWVLQSSRLYEGCFYVVMHIWVVNKSYIP